ncbi:hypothetical protein [Cryobacterium tagatosivorans]|uniref:hypothetical protein n=1 Tax=Cryobacterium tagatosivorans TaxID=1259199 RepID=UPI00141BD8E7|nr:hypothetical protein [Cryobacterium tagatosivorans]
MSEPVTPADLSRDLQVTQKRIRDYLREKYGTLPPHVSRWLLTDEQATDVRIHFRS